MSRKASSALVGAIVITALLASSVYAVDYKRLDIKYGMHEKIVNEKYGQPIAVKKVKINPIPKKKALYQIDDNNYMILHFFSGRINKIELLEDMDRSEALKLFES